MTGRVLLLGGLDPSGGAGVTLDAAVVALHGAEPLPVAVALTVQGRRGFVRSHPVPPSVLEEQVRVLLADGPVQAAKLGFVGDAGALRSLVAVLALLDADVPLVVDPVLSATAGGLSEPDGLSHGYRELVMPRATLVTPNVPELDALAGGDPQVLLGAGAAAVLVKGGHRDSADAVDELHTTTGVRRFVRRRLPSGPVRGTGCALASAIAARLARGTELAPACEGAGNWLAARLAHVIARDDGLPQHLPLADAR